MTTLGTDIRRHAARLRDQMVAGLLANGTLNSPQWRAAFEHVPRHIFAPSFYQQTPTSQRKVDNSNLKQWLEAVYDDTLLLIRADASSSSTAPSLMATMLEALDPDDGGRVLEIGTGSGYNAALLCHRLGDRNVTTLDLDRRLVNDAGGRLASIGYRPSIVTSDGARGWPDNAPYDRLIATCAVDAIPPAWLTQVRPGGRIVAPIATGITVLTVDGPDAATGRFLSESAYFMPLRGDGEPQQIDATLRTVAEAHAAAEPTDLGVEVWFDNGFRFLLAVATPGVQCLTSDANGGATFAHPDGSWAQIRDREAKQGGKRKLWDEVERAHQLWNELGHPNRDQFTLSIATAGQRIHLDGTQLAWDLPHP